MFKINCSADEIYQSMEKSIASNNLENKYGFNKLARAIDYLNSAAEIFENSNMASEADEIVDLMLSFAQSVTPEFTTIPEGNSGQSWKGQQVQIDPNSGKKFIITPNLTKRYLPAEMQPGASKSKNKFGLSESDVERVQLALNKVIKDYIPTKPQTIVPDQKWGQATEAAFSWYDKNTHNSPMQSIKALLDSTGKKETVGGK